MHASMLWLQVVLVPKLSQESLAQYVHDLTLKISFILFLVDER